MQSIVCRSGPGLASGFLLGLMLTLSVPLQAQPSETEPLPLEHVAHRLTGHEPLRIVAFGSSSTPGVDASSPAASYPSRLEAELTRLLQGRDAVPVLNRGIAGEDAEDMLLRLSRVIAEHPDLIIWQTGSKDPLGGVPLDRFVQETIAGIAPVLTEQTLTRAQMLSPDGLHMTDGGYAKLAEAIAQDILRRAELPRVAADLPLQH